jgi:ATP adenylyltransferase/5',5'''-P-1,P-4-tetraphosphate phosphorylase II
MYQIYNIPLVINKNKICCGVMVFNATFNNISVISWQSVLFVEETTDLPQVTDKQIFLEKSNLEMSVISS